MSKVFLSRVDGSFFKFLSRIWDRLPQKDRDLLAEYWRGVIRGVSDEYLHYLQVEAANGVLTIKPYEVRKWRRIDITKTYSFDGSITDGLISDYPSGRSDPAYLDGKYLRFSGKYRSGQAVYTPIDPGVDSPQCYLFETDFRVIGDGGTGETFLGFCSYSSPWIPNAIGLSVGKLSTSSLSFVASYTEGPYLVNEGEEIYNGNAKAVGPNEILLPTGVGNTLKGIDFRNDTWAIVFPSDGTGDSYRITGLEGDVLGIEGAVTVTGFSVPVKIFRSLGTGILSQGYLLGVEPSDSVLEGKLLGGVSLSGGQAAVRIGKGTYNKIRLYLDSLTPATISGIPQPVYFRVYVSKDNTPGSYRLITDSTGVELVEVSPGIYELTLEGLGITVEEGSWIKVIPTDSDVVYEFSNRTYPLVLYSLRTFVNKDWYGSVSSSDQITLKLLIGSEDGIDASVRLIDIPLDPTFDFKKTHRYKLRVNNSVVEVYVDDQLVSTQYLSESAARYFDAAGFWTLPGGIGQEFVVSFLRHTRFNIDDRIVELPALYDRYELQTLILEENVDYEINPRGVLKFFDLDKVESYDYLIAEYVSFTGKRIEAAYGQLVGVSGEDSREMRNRTAAVWRSLLDGPTLDSIRKGVHAFLGLPILFDHGFVTDDPTDPSSITIDGVKYTFPAPVGVGVNPLTGQPFKKGDYVPPFSALAGGVRVRDYIVKKDWWHAHSASGAIHELQKWHTFEVEIDSQLLTSTNIDEIRSFLDRIRKIGDNYFLVALEKSEELLVIEGNSSRADLLSSDSRRVFVGDSSDPAIVCTPYISSQLAPVTFGYGIFGALSYDQAQAIFSSLSSGSALNDNVFGDLDDLYAQFTTLITGTGQAISTNIWEDVSADYAAAGIQETDLLVIGTQVFTVLSVLSSTRLLINLTAGSLPTTPTSYSIKRIVGTSGVALPFVYRGGIQIREGARLQIKADDYEEVNLLIGFKEQTDPLSPPQYFADDIVAALVKSDGTSKIPGTIVYKEAIKVDPRDFDAFTVPPTRVCIRTISSKGFNSRITISDAPEINAADDLRIATGHHLGRVGFPGLEDVNIDANGVATGIEPNSRAVGSSTAGPYRESEREAQLGNYKQDVGLTLEADIQLYDGTTVRRDTDGQQYFVAETDPGYEGAGFGQPYQSPIAGSAQFGTFYVDYVSPQEEYPYIFTDGAITSPNTLTLTSVPEYIYSGTATVISETVIVDASLDIGRVRIGDSVTVQGQTGIVEDVYTGGILTISGVTLIPSASEAYTLRMGFAPGDWVLLHAPAGGSQEASIYRIAQITSTEILLEGPEGETLSLTDDFPIVGRVVRDPLPYGLNNDIPFYRTDRVQKAYNPGADDYRPAQDALDIEVLLPSSSGVSFVYEGTSVALPIGHVFREQTGFSGTVSFTNSSGTPVAIDESIATGYGNIIAGNKFQAADGADFWSEGIREGDYLHISGSTLGNNGSYQIVAITTTTTPNDTLLLATSALIPETGVAYYASG